MKKTLLITCLTGLLLANSGYSQPNVTPRYEPITIAQNSAEESTDSESEESASPEYEEQKERTEMNENTDTLDSKLDDAPVEKVKKIKRLDRQFEKDYIAARTNGLCNPEYTLGSDNYPFLNKININPEYTPIKTNWNETVTDFSQIEEIANSLSYSITERPLPKELSVKIVPKKEFEEYAKKEKLSTTTGCVTRIYSAKNGWKFNMNARQMPKKEAILLFMHEYGHIISGHPDTYASEAISDTLMHISHYLLSKNDKTYELDLSSDDSVLRSITPVKKIIRKAQNLYNKDCENDLDEQQTLEKLTRTWNYLNTHKKEEIDNLKE